MGRYFSGISPFFRAPWWFKQLGYPHKAISIFPMTVYWDTNTMYYVYQIVVTVLHTLTPKHSWSIEKRRPFGWKPSDLAERCLSFMQVFLLLWPNVERGLTKSHSSKSQPSNYFGPDIVAKCCKYVLDCSHQMFWLEFCLGENDGNEDSKKKYVEALYWMFQDNQE